MAGILVADGAFGLIGWETKTQESCSDQAISHLESRFKKVLITDNNF